MPVNTSLTKKYIKYPDSVPRLSGVKRLFRIFVGLILSPIYWFLAFLIGTPGLEFRRKCAVVGIRILFSGQDLAVAYKLIINPMDSVRYFEFDYMWNQLKGENIQTYLDVSSPRLFPAILIKTNKKLRADLVNPDKKDLPITVKLLNALNLSHRCNFHNELLESAQLETNKYDVITSISVIEHIPDDKEAIKRIWGLLKPGGKLLISVPCSKLASEEFRNINEYELLDSDKSTSLDNLIYKGIFYSNNYVKSRGGDRLLYFFETNMITNHIKELIEKGKVIEVARNQWILKN